MTTNPIHTEEDTHRFYVMLTLKSGKQVSFWFHKEHPERVVIIGNTQYTADLEKSTNPPNCYTIELKETKPE